MTEPKHYKRGPSGASRWLICTDSPEAEESYPDETSDAADEGSAAHWLLEQCLKAGEDCQDWVDRNPDTRGADGYAYVWAGSGADPDHDDPGTLKDWPITGEMIEAVQAHIDEVEKHSKKRGTRLFVEERVHVDERYCLEDVVGGTADTIMWLPKSKTLCVYDFKYGKGHVVEVDDKEYCVNPQVGIYAIAALCNLERLLGKKVEVKWIEVAIIQPRAYHKKGPVRRKKISPLQLMSLEGAMIHAVNGPKVRVPGDHCFFCRHKPDCIDHNAYRGEIATGGFEAEVPDENGNQHHHTLEVSPSGAHSQSLDPSVDLSIEGLISRPVKGLTLQELARARKMVGPLKAWAKEVEEEVRTRLLHDLQVPGTKLAQGPGSRAFGGDPCDVNKAVEDTIDALGLEWEDLYETQLKSPAKLEKHLGKATFKSTPLAPLVTYTAGGPVVVDEDSDKPEYRKDGDFEAEIPPDSIDSPLL